ncbi:MULTISPECIES: aspartate/glutamate racemase family protein [unclassified Microbulbifer]|uniref:aspartate/glutamate racemase family protein n=1 Tax=unclassified Microbulbifer TaxID=2619833 RepID=UPI0027E41C1D|nr:MULTISPECIES: aspartate/glutamate racemase family protein [unclassified Microbulbifer]
MKTVGLIGGMSWESTQIYYRRINELVKERLGGLHSARLLLYSVDFHEIEQLQHAGRWEEAGELLAAAARSLAAAGADFLLICTNTMHKIAPAVEAAVSIPLLHIADATAAEIGRAGARTVGLLGTRFTMEENFYRGRLQEEHGIPVLLPDAEERALVHQVIYQELCLGTVRDESRAAYRDIIRRLVERGAEGIILGCTEIGMLVTAADAPVPLFDTTEIHARAAVDRALLDIT